ncbi:MAG TPA: helicase-related protein [Anaerolineales bacterium]|nr:helicase-related protein [Anaerolineales bacterium]
MPLSYAEPQAIPLGEVIVCAFGNERIRAGKTTISIAIAEYLRAALERRGAGRSPYPGLVVGPGVVTGQENWPKEIREVTPGATGKVITIGVKPLPKTIKIGEWLKRQNLNLDENRLAGRDADWSLDHILAAAKEQDIILEEQPLRQALQRAAKNPPARRKGASGPNLLDGRIGGLLWTGRVLYDEENAGEIARKYSLPQFIAEHQAGKIPEKSFAILSYETAKLGSGRVPAMRTRKIRVWTEWEDWRGKHRASRLETIYTCPQCGAVVAEKYDEESGKPIDPINEHGVDQFIGIRRRCCQAHVTKRVWNPAKGKHETATHDEYGKRLVCGNPLFEETALRRESAASYALKKVRKTFGLLLVDEVHQAKAKGTGVGWTLGAFSGVSRWTIGLTGTLFGGYSTSIFMLWYRLIGEVRREFSFDGDQKWAEKFGLLKRVFYTESDAVVEDGAYTGAKFFDTVSEKPGISPAIVRYGLPYCTFSSLKDIGLPLPGYSEQIVRIPMTEAMRVQCIQADGSKQKAGLFAWALEQRKDPTGKGAISVWLNTALNRPDAMWRYEDVFFNRNLGGRGRWANRKREQVCSLPEVVGQGEWLPKETWLADTCQAERLMGRKTLVFVRQTGERDIQERLKACLEARGLRVGILRPTLAPARRATWIKQHASQFDVLLSNARLVQVGLNLTTFSTAVFFELEWSLYVVWQAMRRLYRPGAPKPVKLYFPVYEDTLEESALDLIGAKMTAAMMFYGDEVGGALTEGDEGDLLNDIVRAALGKLNVGRSEGMFSVGSTSSDSAYGSPTAISPLLVSWAQWAVERNLVVARRSKKQRQVQTGQAMLF